MRHRKRKWAAWLLTAGMVLGTASRGGSQAGFRGGRF